MAPCGALFAALAALPAASAGLPEVTWSHGEWQPFVPEKDGRRVEDGSSRWFVLLVDFLSPGSTWVRRWGGVFFMHG